MDTLRTAGGDGRLTAEELDARVERALSARTQGELAALVADLSAATATATKDVLVVQQTGGKWARAGRWTVPDRIEVRTKLCRVTFDFTDAVITVAQKIQTLFIDDLDGSAAEGTVRFGLDGTEYEIDLNARHAQELPATQVLPGGSAALPSGRRPARAGDRQAG